MAPKLIEVDPRDLQANPWNTNIVSPENEAKLDASVDRLGVFKPVVARELPDGTLQILGGEHRRDSAIRKGISPIPVFNLGPVDDQKAKEIGLADNSRYGTDDILSLHELLSGFDDPELLQTFLPYNDLDIKAIFASSNIALEALDDEEIDDQPEEIEAPAPKAPKTHTIMRFKVPLGDAERISEHLHQVQKDQGFTLADDLTNAGDALVHLLLNKTISHDD